MVTLSSLAVPRTDGTGLGTRSGRFMLVAAWALTVFGAVLNQQLEFAPWLFGPLIAGLLGAVLVTRPSANHLAPKTAAAVVIYAAVACTVLFGMQLQHEMLWLYTFASYLIGALAMRGNMLAAGIGGTIVWGVGIAWLWQQNASLSGYILVMSMPVLITVVCIVWNRALAYVASGDIRFRSEAERARLAKIAADRDATRSREELAIVRREVGPLLVRLAEGEPVSDKFRLELRVAEASIRDRICSSNLLHPRLEAAVLGLRCRGGDVILIGEARDGELHVADRAGSGAVQISDALAYAVADFLHALGAGATVTIRSIPNSAEATLSLLIRAEDVSQHIRFSGDGTVLSQK